MSAAAAQITGTMLQMALAKAIPQMSKNDGGEAVWEAALRVQHRHVCEGQRGKKPAFTKAGDGDGEGNSFKEVVSKKSKNVLEAWAQEGHLEEGRDWVIKLVAGWNCAGASDGTMSGLLAAIMERGLEAKAAETKSVPSLIQVLYLLSFHPPVLAINPNTLPPPLPTLSLLLSQHSPSSSPISNPGPAPRWSVPAV